MRFHDFEGESVGPLREFEGQGGHCRSGTVFDGQGDPIVARRLCEGGLAAEIEVGITPGMELGGTTQGLAGPHVAGTFARVVDDDDGDPVATLQIAQIGEQRGDLAADVFIDAVQPHEWVEDEQARLQPDDGFVEAGTVGIEVEAQASSLSDLTLRRHPY